ncbi:MAG TPA: hypothetical protein VMT49_00890 [Steroidobacteraceae bacterium]|nr:hypothetical protein [Steroidobacteraceae bacterium]
MRYVMLLTVLALGSGASGAARAGDIYCNNQGRDCSDRPSPGATFVGSTNSQVPATSAPAAPASSSGTAPPSTDAANARLGAEATRAAVQKDVAASHAEQCKAAKEKYQQSIDARRLYRLNKDGEREYLSDAELDQARLNARLEMERACGSPSS